MTDQIGIQNYVFETTYAIQGHLETSSLALPAVPAAKAGIKEFSTTEGFWRALITEQVRARKVVMLRDVLLSEWFPRSPGLFLTSEAKRARAYANQFIMPQTEARRGFYLAPGPSDPVVYEVVQEKLKCFVLESDAYVLRREILQTVGYISCQHRVATKHMRACRWQ